MRRVTPGRMPRGGRNTSRRLGASVTSRCGCAIISRGKGQQFEYGYDDIGNRKVARAGGSEVGTDVRDSIYAPNSLNQYVTRTVPGIVDIIGMASAGDRVRVNNDYAYRRGEYFYKAVGAGRYSPVWITLNDSQSSTLGYAWAPLPSPEQFVHDLDGNLTQDGRWSLTWDGENRLVKLESGVGPQASLRKQEFEYDYQGRCIRKKSYVFDSSYYTYQLVSDTKYLYEGWSVVAELNASNGLVKSYLWGLDLSGSREGAGGVGGLVKMTSYTPSTTHHFYAYDGNGNVVGLVDASYGTASAQYEYGPFGELLRATGPMAKANAFRFSTKYQDDETDLVMYLHRPYSPSTGRWLTHDPMEEDGGPNLYAAFRNNPLQFIDALGLWNSDIHHDATKRWAIALGYPDSDHSRAAEVIATADNDVDSFGGGTSPFPVIGDPSYHFNRNGSGIDSRLQHWAEHDNNARAACTIRAGSDDPYTAAIQLGTSLHPLQDWVAHGDYFIKAHVLLEGHNASSPQHSFGDPTWAYPDAVGLDAVGSSDGRAAGAAMHYFTDGSGMQHDYAIFKRGTQRLRLTKTKTDRALSAFRNYVRINGGCACKTYFGVE